MGDLGWRRMVRMVMVKMVMKRTRMKRMMMMRMRMVEMVKGDLKYFFNLHLYDCIGIALH